MTMTPMKLQLTYEGDRSGVNAGFPYSSKITGMREYSFSDTKIGFENPKWKSQVATHRSATTTYVRSTMRIQEAVPGSYRIRMRINDSNNYIEQVKGHFVYFHDPGMIGVLSLPDQRTSNLALIRFVKKCNEESRTYRGFVGLGELLETVHAIRHPLQSLKKGFGDYSKAVVRNSKERVRGLRTSGARRRAVAQAISGTYLEYANGWSPLVRDIDDLSNTVARALELHTSYYSEVKASASTTELVGRTDYSGYSTVGELSYYATSSGTKTSSVRIVGELKCDVSGDSSWLSKSFGITPKDFLPSVWELLPLSYVVNAFVDITGALETIGFDPATLSWSSRSARTSATITYTGRDLGARGGAFFTLLQGDPGYVKLQGISLARDQPLSFYAPPVFRLPSVGNWSRLANFSSLLVQFRASSTTLWKLIG